MEDKTVNDSSQNAEQKSTTFYIVIAVAGLTFFILDMLNDFVASPLRECSSFLADMILTLLSYPVERHGTILTVGNLEFSVVPACSGSTTLQVLITLGIYWCWTHKKLTVTRRLICSLLTIPIAILANGIRVSALVGMSFSINDPITEGPLHSAIGLIGFTLAMISVFLVTEALSTEKKSNGISKKVQAGILLVIMFMIYMPFMSSCLSTWMGNAHDPYDRFGFVFVILAVVPFLLYWRETQSDFRFQKFGLLLFIVAMLLVLTGALIDIKYLLGFSIICAIVSLCLSLKGLRFTVNVIPLIVLIYFGFPKITVQMNFLTSKLLGLSAWGGSIWIRIFVLVCCLAIFYHLKKKKYEMGEKEGGVKVLPASMALASIVLAVQVYIYSSATNTMIKSELKMSFLQSGYTGSKQPTSRQSLEYFGKSNIWSRVYRKDDKAIEVLITASGGDRHKNHPPEYCMTGDGWEIISSEKIKKEIGPLGNIEVTRMRMTKGGEEQNFVYWFTDGTESKSDYTSMMMGNAVRMLTGQRTNWYLFRIISGLEDEEIGSFLDGFEFEIVNEQRK